MKLNTSEPLGLPRGSVRAIVTILLLLMLALTLFVPIAAGAESVRTALIALCAIAVRDYFGIRQAQNQQDGPPLEPPAIG